jgi:DNA replication protein DnaC
VTPITLDKQCTTCGIAVQAEVPPEIDQDSRWYRLAERMPVYCDPCGEEAEHDIARQEHEQAEARHLQRITASGIPANLRGVSFDRLDNDEALAPAVAAAKSWAGGEIRGLVLSGTVGVGKTWIAAAAANQYLRRSGLYWIATPRLMLQARAGFKSNERDAAYKVLLKRSVPLVLDDIDKVAPSDFTLDLLFEAIDERVNSGTALLVTTNLHYPDLEDRFGEPIASRLAGYCKAHRLDGPDRRRS